MTSSNIRTGCFSTTDVPKGFQNLLVQIFHRCMGQNIKQSTYCVYLRCLCNLQYIGPINNSELWNVRHVFIFYKLLFNLILQITSTDQ